MRLKLSWGTLILLVSAAMSSGTTAEREQLPSGVTPLHYELDLVPDAANLTFRGRVRITIDVEASTAAIVLNADELTLDKAVLDTKGDSASIALVRFQIACD